MTKLQTELTTQHGTRLLTMTPTADTITVVRHCAVIQCTKLHHRSQLGTLALSQLINLTKNMKLFTNVSVANKTATKTHFFIHQYAASIIYGKNTGNQG